MSLRPRLTSHSPELYWLDQYCRIEARLAGSEYSAQVMLHVNALVLLASMYWTFLSVVTIFVMYILFTLAIFLKMRQLQHRLSRMAGARMSERRFDFYRANLARLVRLFAECSSHYGAMIVWFVVVNTPTNAYLVNLLLFDSVGTSTALVLCAVIFAQLTGLFLVHYSAATYATRFHKAAPVFLGANLGRLRTRHRLRLAALIEVVHTSNSYGVTYGKYGQISMLSLLKVSAHASPAH